MHFCPIVAGLCSLRLCVRDSGGFGPTVCSYSGKGDTYVSCMYMKGVVCRMKCTKDGVATSWRVPYHMIWPVTWYCPGHVLTVLIICHDTMHAMPYGQLAGPGHTMLQDHD